MKTQWTMIYWQSDTCWLGKLLEHPEIITLGETLEELEENLKEAYLLRILADVPDGYQTKTIRCEIPAGKTMPIPGIGSMMRSAVDTVRDASKKGVETASSVKTQWTMIYWQSDTCWLGKLLEHPEIITLGETLEELEENLKEAYLLRILADVPDGYQTKTIRGEIPARKTMPIPGFGSRLRSAADTVVDASKKGVDTASAAIAEGSQTGFRKIVDTASSVADSARDASKQVSEVTVAAAATVKTSSKKTWDATTSVADTVLVTTQGLLASRLSEDLNDLLQNMVKGGATIYDKAMDAEYIATHIGGANHRLFDGGHTIAGAINAARDASPDDTIIQEALGTIQGLLRDGTTLKGLPLANWDTATYEQVAETLTSNFHIPTSWFSDLITYDATELLGSAIGVLALALNWNRADTETFARLVGSMGVSAVASANPLLLVVTVVALAKAFHKAHQTGEYAEFLDGQLKGAIGSGATLAAVALVGAASGPSSVGLLVGLIVGVLAHKATKDVSFVQIAQFLAGQATAAATTAKEIAATQKQRWDDATARGGEMQKAF